MFSSTLPEPTAIGRLNGDSLLRAIRRGWRLFLLTRTLSVSYAMIFAFFGMAMLLAVVHASFAPMIVPLAGGFMLLGPILLSGFFALADRVDRREPFGFRDILSAFRQASADMLALALACAVLFVVWVTDTSLLYGFLVGAKPAPLAMLFSSSENTLTFLLASSLVGLVLASLIFALSAFSVPLLYHRRARLVRAVYLSVLAIRANFVYSLLWAVILSLVIIASILVFPLFLLTFPVLAFASHEIYHELFPESGLPAAEDDLG